MLRLSERSQASPPFLTFLSSVVTAGSTEDFFAATYGLSVVRGNLEHCAMPGQGPLYLATATRAPNLSSRHRPHGKLYIRPTCFHRTSGRIRSGGPVVRVTGLWAGGNNWPVSICQNINVGSPSHEDEVRQMMFRERVVTFDEQQSLTIYRLKTCDFDENPERLCDSGLTHASSQSSAYHSFATPSRIPSNSAHRD
jgi:hypothetical protein